MTFPVEAASTQSTVCPRPPRACSRCNPGFGAQGTAGDAAGHSVAVLAGGGVVTAGTVAGSAQVARLTAAGAADPAFHAGTPLDLGAAVGSVDLARR